MHQELPKGRFPTANLRRTPAGAKFLGNYLGALDEFDHRFFKLSSREAASMDPQQRIILQVAYQALESSGYFDEFSKSKSVGCFFGVGSVDYEDNITSHLPNSFSSLGTLRAFISGRVSHHFGWSGPSITYDTACSSSAVAIHSACKAILLGECSTALAGGVNAITSPSLHENLNRAGFLSPTGPTRSFDAAADGYCRGEGAGLVYLKRLSAAIADGDPVAGVIVGSAVSQSNNSTPITAPDTKSQSALYRKVLSIADSDPMIVSYVEAHGTGTPIGDPTECESIRQVFGGPRRRDKLYFGSIKANIGHTEAASGVAALIKAVLMIQKATVPKQANFTKLNPKIPALKPDRMDIAVNTQRWTGSVICLNNYGAAGSNATMLVCQPPAHLWSHDGHVPSKKGGKLLNYPIHLRAHSTDSLRAYCVILRQFLSQKNLHENDVASVAFNLAHRTNQSLDTFTTMTARSIPELRDELLTRESAQGNFRSQPQTPKKAVVLCFGGQIGNSIGLNEQVYQHCSIFRMHLDNCNIICHSLGVKGMFPGIFSKNSVGDLVLLHCMLFALQYSCAKSWIDCGLRVDALIGHSFGQLTALCVSGSMSLGDAMKLVKGRADLIQQFWGPQRGAMISIESNLETVSEIMTLARKLDAGGKIEVACYNGPDDHVLVGTEPSIKAIEDIVQSRQTSSQSLKAKRIQVTHGFHSYLVDPIVPGLVELAKTINFQRPDIPVETCTTNQKWHRVNPTAIADHSRQPVYFSEAVRRLEARYGPCTWLEAGTSSPITSMARRALGIHAHSGHTFQPISVTSTDALEILVGATMNLWNSGLKVQFWSFHRLQNYQYSQLNLPPYQFEKQRHWLEYKPVIEQKILKSSEASCQISRLLTFVSFLRPQNEGRSIAEFTVDPESREFKAYIQGHTVLGSSLCPASLYIHLAAKAASSLFKDCAISGGPLGVKDLQMQAPLGIDPERKVKISMESADDSPRMWSFNISSQCYTDPSSQTNHAVGTVYLQSTDNGPIETALDGYERKMGNRRVKILAQDGGETSIDGFFIYKTFASVVEYSEYFKGLKRISAVDSEIAGRIVLPKPPVELSPNADWPPLLTDNFIQLAGLHVNFLRDRGPDDIWICTKIDQLQQSPSFRPERLGAWEAYSCFEEISGKERVNNIYVFDPRNEALVVTLLGAHFTKVPIGLLEVTLSRISPNERGKLRTTEHRPATWARPTISDVSKIETCEALAPVVLDAPIRGGEGNANGSVAVREMLSAVTDVPIEDMKDDSRLEAIGVDSLMTTEVLEEIEKVFDVKIPMSEFQDLIDLKSLCQYLRSKSYQMLGNADMVEVLNYTKDKPIVDISSSPQKSEINDIQQPAFIGVSANQILETFGKSKTNFDNIAKETGLAGFETHVHPRQNELVITYVTEAFEKLGVDLSRLKEGDRLPNVPHVSMYKKLMAQIHTILKNDGLIYSHGDGWIRTGRQINDTPSHNLVEQLLQDFPQHWSEHKLLGATGPHLADCLSGKTEARDLVLGSKAKRSLLEDVYSNAPSFAAGTRLLRNFISNATALANSSNKIRILEVGAGTGSTTKQIVEELTAKGIPFTYVFTDISSSLVATAKKTFAPYEMMEFMVLDIEKFPPEHLVGSQDIIISTNAIHATRSLVLSCSNIYQMLRPTGMLCLIELTRNLYWFDIVFGLLEGWWLFEDSRTHVLADELIWKQNLLKAGFEHVDWTRGDSDESNGLRLIIAIAAEAAHETYPAIKNRNHTTIETIQFQRIDDIPLYADLYYPHEISSAPSKRPIGMSPSSQSQLILVSAKLVLAFR